MQTDTRALLGNERPVQNAIVVMVDTAYELCASSVGNFTIISHFFTADLMVTGPSLVVANCTSYVQSSTLAAKFLVPKYRTIPLCKVS